MGGRKFSGTGDTTGGQPSQYVPGMLRLRHIKKKFARSPTSIWPPAWGAPYALPPDARDKGVLTAVRRIGHCLSLTLRFNKQDYVTLLDEWKPPPTVDQVEATLTKMIGMTVQQVGEADIGQAPLIVPDELGF
jgi:hypothetical protein